jgi:hypothetical protein
LKVENVIITAKREVEKGPGVKTAGEMAVLQGKAKVDQQSPGNVASEEMGGRLHRAGEQRGKPRAALSGIFLRSRWESAMFHEGYSAEEIKRRDRWRSECWRIYVWESREQNRGPACKMFPSSFTLLTSLERFERHA